MDRLAAMQTFVRVIDLGSFAAAAREQNLSPAVVTRQVAELEAHLGARLINRTTRRLALTDTGERYLARVRQILAEVQDAEAMATEAVAEPRGLLRVLCPPALAVHQLTRLLAAFRERCPQVQVELTVQDWVATVDGQHDLSLITATEPLVDAGFVARLLARWEVLLCAAPEYLARRGRPAHPRELAGHEMLLPTFVGEVTMRRQRDADPAAPAGEAVVLGRPRSGLSTDHFETLYAAALTGLGVASLPSYVAEDALRHGRLERLLPDWNTRSGLLYAAVPSRQYLPARTRALLDFLTASFGGHDADPWLACLGRSNEAASREP